MVRAIQFQNKRVGSTFLQKAIDSHPEIKGVDEVFVNVAKKPGMRKSGFVPFVRSDVKDPGEYIKEVVWKTHNDYNVIFKLMYNQIHYHSGLRDFIARENLPIIHLRRKNLVKQVISGITAATTKHDPVVITPKGLYQKVQSAEREAELYVSSLRDQIKLTLWYEEIIGETHDGYTFVNKSTMKKICDFFAVGYFPLCAQTKKKNKDDISVYLPNIDEIRKFFKGSKYAWMVKGE